jgi:hypothetical protein
MSESKNYRTLDAEQLAESTTEPDCKELSYDEVVDIARVDYEMGSNNDLEIDDEPEKE